MKEKILVYLASHPDSRKRMIASDIGIWQCDAHFLAAMRELEQAGQIKATYHKDYANMDFYFTFSFTVLDKLFYLFYNRLIKRKGK